MEVSVGSLNIPVDISTTHVYYETFLDPSLAMPSAVGGIAAGTTAYDLRGDTITSILNDLLFPTVQPTLNAPTASIAMSPATTLYEVSTNIPSLQFTTTFSQGSIYNGATYQNVRSGSCNNYNYTGTFPVDISKNTSPDVQSYQYYVKYGGAGVQSWACTVGYNQGPQPKDNKGNNAVAGPLAAGSVITNTLSMEGSYPYFASSVTIGVLTKQTLLSMATNPMPSSTTGFSLVTESGGLKQQFDIPNARLALASLKGIKTYNTVSGQWEYELGTNTLSLTRWTTSQVTQSIQGFSTPYTRYTYNGTDRAAVQVQLQF